MYNSAGNKGGNNKDRPFTESRIIWGTATRNGVAKAARFALADTTYTDNRPSSSLGTVLDWIFTAPDVFISRQRLEIVRDLIKEEITGDH